MRTLVSPAATPCSSPPRGGFDPFLLIGLAPESAEECLREAGIVTIRRVETAPPGRRPPSGDWRVLRCTLCGTGEAELLVARANERHPTVETALFERQAHP